MIVVAAAAAGLHYLVVDFEATSRIVCTLELTFVVLI